MSPNDERTEEERILDYKTLLADGWSDHEAREACWPADVERGEV